MRKISILLCLLTTLKIGTAFEHIDDMLLDVGFFNGEGGSGDPITESGDPIVSGDEPANQILALESFPQTEYANTNIPAEIPPCIHRFHHSKEPICYMGRNKLCLIKEHYKKSDTKLRKQIISFLNRFLHENFADEQSRESMLVMNPKFKNGIYKTIIEIPPEGTLSSVYKLYNQLKFLAYPREGKE